jgi:hypothetical protein
MRKTLIILLCCTATLLATYAGYRGYRVWKQGHLVSMAKDFLGKSDVQNAMLCLRRALQSNPRNVEACRLVAQILERNRSSQAALVWRSRVVECKPDSTEDRLALAHLALTMGDYMTSTNALEGVSAAGRKTLGFQNLAGTVAAAMGDKAQAEHCYLEAARIDPQSLVPVLNVSVLRLQSTNEQTVADARSTLKAVASNPTNAVMRCKALRELTLHALHHKQAEEAMALSERLVQDTNSSFSDRLLRLDVLAYTTNAQLNATLEGYKRQAATNSAMVYDLASWQLSMLGPTQALAWLRTLPPSIQTNQPVALLEARCYDVRTDAHALQLWLKDQNWGDLDYVRRAFLCRALRQQELTDSAKAEWEQALKAANNQKPSLALLLKFAAEWHMNKEGEDILWIFVNRFPTERWAYDVLSKTLYLGGRTREIMNLCGQQAKKNPADLLSKNNLAVTALLLNAQEVKPHELAREVYEKSPTNASYASTYAFSLYLQKKNNEAREVIEKLDPKLLQKPSIAGYYGLILKATGSGAKASSYFDYAFKSSLLPEERKLFEKANAGA